MASLALYQCAQRTKKSHMTPSSPAAIQTVVLARNVDDEPLSRNIKVLLVKPYQATPTVAESPPLGLLCLSASLKEAFGSRVTVKVLDMKLYRDKPESIVDSLRHFDADIVGAKLRPPRK